MKKEAQAGTEQRKQIGDLEKHVQQLQQANERGEQLISEYKVRIDSLSALVADQQDAVNQAKAPDYRLTELTRLTDSQALEIEALTVEHEREIHRREELSQDSAVRHQREIEDIKARAELEQEKALLAERRQLQDQLNVEREVNNAEQRKLYADMDKLRQQLAESKQVKANSPVAKPKSGKAIDSESK